MMKSARYVLIICLYAGVSYGQARPATQPPKLAVAPQLHEVEIKDLPDFTRYNYVRSARDPFLDKSVTATIIGAYKPSVMDKLVLLSWLNEGGRTVIYVQNTETNEVQKITSEPNKENFRIVEIRPNPDPKLFEAVISNGEGVGTVKFRLTLPHNPNQQPGSAGSPTPHTTSPTPHTKNP